ncbi:hypothetical protein V1503_24955 [Bacillus sp. SCS-151]|uniref:hypothetical protein n=1 Tax=Nanhaiella sioensis TaxID=3115293 RepID=UPI00397B125F
MADKNDVVMIELDRPRMLWYGHKALKTLTAMTGKDIDAMMSEEEFDLEDFEKIMYCGLLKDAKVNNETLKLEDMEDLLDEAPYHVIMGKMQEAFQAAFGQFDTGDSKNAQRMATKNT